MASFELFGSESCPYTAEMREWLEYRRADFVEYDVEADPAALVRMREIAPGQNMVPVLAENGKVVRAGWEGRGCIIAELAGPGTTHA